MPIKIKNIFFSTETSLDPLQKHINNMLIWPKEKIDHAEIKLKTACMGTDLIKKNTEKLEKGEAKKLEDLDLKSPEVKDKLTVFNAVTENNSQQTIKDYLSALDNIRKENQLVYGKKNEKQNLSLGLGLGLVNPEDSQHPLFKKALTSTLLSSFQIERVMRMGAIEFGLTYDNKIFVVSKLEDPANNLYRMAQGTLLKAVGCIQIGKIKVRENIDGSPQPKLLTGQVEYISIYNAFFEVPPDNIAISLFALKRLGVDLSSTKVLVPSDKAPSMEFLNPFSGCHITIRGEIKNAAYYLNEARFSEAKALAEKKLTFLDKLIELFCSIDDEILIKRDKNCIKDIYDKKELLKLNLIKLFNCAEEGINEVEKKDKNKAVMKSTVLISPPSTSAHSVGNPTNLTVESNVNIQNSTESFIDYYQHMKSSIAFFKGKNVDLNFLIYEINMILAYLFQNSLIPKEKNQLEEWIITKKMPGRGLDAENIPSYIQFYDQNPVKTCIALLKDYSKETGWVGGIYRFFSGAWNRNYKNPVNKFLSTHRKNELPDNLTICAIYNKLREAGLIFNWDAESKSSLRKVLLFCAKLNNEEEALCHLLGASLHFGLLGHADESIVLLSCRNPDG